MHADSPQGSVYALDLSGLRAPDVTVWTAWAGERVAAVGALKRLGDSEAEVKSMRTHPDFARRGAGAAILETIITAARARHPSPQLKNPQRRGVRAGARALHPARLRRGPALRRL
jgi:GNAT superfamily N-acetyltransferase